jgi:hypothetical protein
MSQLSADVIILTFNYHQGRSGQYLDKMKNPLLETLLE